MVVPHPLDEALLHTAEVVVREHIPFLHAGAVVLHQHIPVAQEPADHRHRIAAAEGLPHLTAVVLHTQEAHPHPVDHPPLLQGPVVHPQDQEGKRIINIKYSLINR